MTLDLLTALTQAEAALGDLSNALFDALGEPGDKTNIQWADAAVDRALRDLAQMRQWLEGA